MGQKKWGQKKMGVKKSGGVKEVREEKSEGKKEG